MVFYTCSGCGESLKKNKVEKHVNVCRSCEYLTCMDCSKDFWGDDYMSHTSCISEEEKYSATGFKAKLNKGEVKQKEWLQKIERISQECTNLSKNAKQLLETLQDYGNVPRKKGKFMNFLKNSLRINDVKLTEEVWEAFSSLNKTTGTGVQSTPDTVNEKKNKDSTTKKEILTCNGNNTLSDKPKKKRKRENADDETTDKKSRKKKRKNENENIEADKAEVLPVEVAKDVNTNKFPWFKAIRACLKAAPDRELSIKKLRKKILNEYSAFGGEKQVKTENELNALFLKKVNKNPKFRVVKEKVKLI